MRSEGPWRAARTVIAAFPSGPTQRSSGLLGRRSLTVALVGVTAVAILTATIGALTESVGTHGADALPTPSATTGPPAPAGPGIVATPADPDGPTPSPSRSDVDPLSGVGTATAVTLLAMEGELDVDLVGAVLGTDGIVAATTTRSATVGLTGSVAADGTPRDVLTDGWRIPVTLIAIDPVGWARHLAGTLERDDLMALGRLAPGRVVLSESSARLRGLGEGARVDLAGARGLEVVGVVTDSAAAGYEFVAHVDDTAIEWIGGRETLLLHHRVDANVEIEQVLERERMRVATTTSARVRVVLPNDGPRVPLVLRDVAVKERFGEFAFRPVPNQRDVVIDPAYIDEWIVTERLPVIGAVRCHRLIMDGLRVAVDELIAAGHEDWLSPRRYGGCFNPRRVGSGRETLSRHAWGIAIDLNVDTSLPGGGAVPPDDVIGIMARHGFRWGGDFTTPDNHHFEWVGEIATLRPERRPTDGD
jgi:hypothetical protein